MTLTEAILRQHITELRSALRIAMERVPEERRMTRHVDDTAGGTYELVEQEWYADARALLEMTCAAGHDSYVRDCVSCILLYKTREAK